MICLEGCLYFERGQGSYPFHIGLRKSGTHPKESWGVWGSSKSQLVLTCSAISCLFSSSIFCCSFVWSMMFLPPISNLLSIAWRQEGKNIFRLWQRIPCFNQYSACMYSWSACLNNCSIWECLFPLLKWFNSFERIKCVISAITNI